MNGLTKILPTCLCLVLLSACGTGLERAEGISPEGSSFDQSLYRGYVDLAKGEYAEGDYRDSDAFAERALVSGTAGGVEPEKIDARGLPADKINELTTARQLLVSTLAKGAAEKMPVEAAQAQVAFDCWMQEQEENRQPDDIAGCRDGFMTAVAKLEDRPVTAAPAPAPAPLPGPWVVNFAFDRSELTPRARSVLSDMVNSAKKADFMTINVNGFTDLVGGDDYNDALSEARTRAVVDFLIESGVQKNKIVGASFGASRPVVPTQEPEERNRRVEIQLSR